MPNIITTQTIKKRNNEKINMFLFGHKWTAPLSEYIEEFGYVPLDNRIASNSVCDRCKEKFKETNE